MVDCKQCRKDCDIHPEYRCSPDESLGYAPVSSKGKTPTTNHGSTGSKLPFDSAAGAPYCDHTFGQFECGTPVDKWGQKCKQHQIEIKKLIPIDDRSQALYDNIVTILEDADGRFSDDRTRFLFIQDVYEEAINYGVNEYAKGFNKGRDDHIDELNHSRSM